MSGATDVRPADLKTVADVLARILPATARTWVFGSRAAGSARRGSDLDLAIDLGRPIEPAEAVALAEAFDDSDLPYAVDIVDLCSVNDRFAAVIEASRLPLPV